ncbi:hypothetical protein BS50DRAFT_162803 [Corynespora cassiicola Philippines]|uniref:Uncharacterized protein n=1 Tax=Corynespora cassiicola Philippines TaxID=1448308 RepID=A0A2T2N6I0_CORCC|nr:hypothetical protein BS50DRAFT_162803 [Corynespora cassiicola Philippines]
MESLQGTVELTARTGHITSPPPIIMGDVKCIDTTQAVFDKQQSSDPILETLSETPLDEVFAVLSDGLPVATADGAQASPTTAQDTVDTMPPKARIPVPETPANKYKSAKLQVQGSSPDGRFEIGQFDINTPFSPLPPEDPFVEPSSAHSSPTRPFPSSPFAASPCTWSPTPGGPGRK